MHHQPAAEQLLQAPAEGRRVARERAVAGALGEERAHLADDVPGVDGPVDDALAQRAADVLGRRGDAARLVRRLGDEAGRPTGDADGLLDHHVQPALHARAAHHVVEPVGRRDVGGVGHLGREQLLVVGEHGGALALELLGRVGEFRRGGLVQIAAGGDLEVPHPLLVQRLIAVQMAPRHPAAADQRQPNLLCHAELLSMRKRSLPGDGISGW